MWLFTSKKQKLSKMEKNIRESKPGVSAIKDSKKSRPLQGLRFDTDQPRRSHSYDSTTPDVMSKQERQIIDLRVAMNGPQKKPGNAKRGSHQSFYYPKNWSRLQMAEFERNNQDEIHDKKDCFLCQIIYVEINELLHEMGQKIDLLVEQHKSKSNNTSMTQQSTKGVAGTTPSNSNLSDTHGIDGTTATTTSTSTTTTLTTTTTSSAKVTDTLATNQLSGATATSSELPKKTPEEPEGSGMSKVSDQVPIDQTMDSDIGGAKGLDAIQMPHEVAEKSTGYDQNIDGNVPMIETIAEASGSSLGTGDTTAPVKAPDKPSTGGSLGTSGDMPMVKTTPMLGARYDPGTVGTRPKVRITAEGKLDGVMDKEPSLEDAMDYAKNFLDKTLNLKSSLVGHKGLCLSSAQKMAKCEIMLSRYIKEYNQLTEDNRLDIVLANDIYSKLYSCYEEWQEHTQGVYGCLFKYYDHGEQISKAADMMATRYYKITNDIDDIMNILRDIIISYAEEENYDLDDTLMNMGEPAHTSSPNDTGLFVTAQEEDIEPHLAGQCISEEMADKDLLEPDGFQTLYPINGAERKRFEEKLKKEWNLSEKSRPSTPLPNFKGCNCDSRSSSVLNGLTSGPDKQPIPVSEPPAVPPLQVPALHVPQTMVQKSVPPLALPPMAQSNLPAPASPVINEIKATPGPPGQAITTSLVPTQEMGVMDPSVVPPSNLYNYHGRRVPYKENHSFDPLKDMRALDPYGQRLMDNYDIAVQGRILREPSRTQSQIKIQALNKSMSPEQAIMFWTAFEEFYEYTNLQWMQKIMHLHNSVEVDLKKTITAFQLYSGLDLAPHEKEQFYKQLYFKIKGVLVKRLSMDKMVYLEDQINDLPFYDQDSTLDQYYMLDDLLTRIVCVAPGDMISTVSPYLRMIQKKLRLGLFREFKHYIRAHNLQLSLLSIQEFINEQIEDLKDAQKLYPNKSKPKKEHKEHKAHTYTTETTAVPVTKDPAEAKAGSEGNMPKRKCPCCSEFHNVAFCPVFKQLSFAKRRTVAEENKLCFHCLKKFHGFCSKWKKCDKCKKGHNFLLSCPKPKPASTNQPAKTEVVKNYHVHSTSSSPSTKYSPFTVACFLVNQATGEGVNTTAYFDNGSDTSLVYKPLAEKIGLQGEERTIVMNTLNKIERKTGISTNDFTVEAIDGSFAAPLNCIALDYKPKFDKKDFLRMKKKYKHLHNVHIPQNSSDSIGVLIGRDNMAILTPLEIRRGRAGQPWAMRFPLGWSVSAPEVEHEEGHCYTTTMECTDKGGTVNGTCATEVVVCESSDTCPHNILEQMAKIESIGITEMDSQFSQAEDRTLKRLVSSLKINDQNQIEIEIPMNAKAELLKNNYELVKKRQEMLEKRLIKLKIYDQYWELIKTQLKSGYIMELVDTCPGKGKKYYIPHFFVLKPESISTPVRIVYDGKCTLGSPISYNDAVEEAPDLQNLLIDILLNFRKHQYAFSIDVKQMFSQIHIPEHQYNWNRFLFRPPGEEKFRTFCHLRWWFGNRSSPTASQLAIVSMADKVKDEYPIGHEIVSNKRYMDDSIETFLTEKEAVRGLQESIKIFDLAGMKVQKLISNSKEVMLSVPLDLRLKGYENGDLPNTKILGYSWNPSLDLLSLSGIKKNEKVPTTKRSLLHTLAAVYDPIGFCSPFTVNSRMLLQRSWVTGCGWDEPLPMEIQKDASAWHSQLEELTNFEIQRQVIPEKIDHIHIFCDSSEYAYGIVAYCVGETHSGLLMSKGRVHPTKPASIPRKELQACSLAAKVGKTLKRVYPGVPFTYWTDSYNCLCWICNDCRRYQQYVGNRVAYIQESSDPSEWRWVPTESNPADLVSRGANLRDLIHNDFWTKGPRFLYCKDEEWPERKALAPPNEEVKKDEYKNIFSLYVRAQDIPTLENFQSLQDLKEAMAQALRSRQGVDPNTPFSAQELEEALQELLKIAQGEGYPDELEDLNSRQRVKVRSPIHKLCPTIDDHGIIRLKTRLEQSDSVPFDTKFPMLLPRDHHLTKLIVLDIHDNIHHAYGNSYVLSVLREKYWVPKGLQVVKKIRRSCVHCQRVHGRPQIPQMAPLPPFRVNQPIQAFQEVGVDYTGAFSTIQGRGRSRIKRYGCIFSCMASRACHIEISASMDTSDFLDCLTRFVSRKGRPKNLYSDRGTNFIGGSRELRQLVNDLDQDQIQSFAARNGFNFNFNPSQSPHFGGSWEAMVKSLKKTIYAILTDRDFTDWELMTAMVQAEDIVNSRPLAFVTADPNDYSVITPNMFITGRMNNQIFPDNLDNQGFDIRTRWRYVQRATRDIWKRWLKEILPNLGQRSKWIHDGREYKVGDEVLIIDPTVGRYKWVAGRITGVNPGRDGRIRVVKINTENGEVESNVHRLIPLS